MKSIILVLLAAFILISGGCEDDSDEILFTQACDDTSSVELDGDVNPELDAGSDDDTQDSVKALDLVGTPTVTISSTTLTCVIMVDDIPTSEALRVYHTELTDSSLNYQWAVKFDIDSDSSNDYILALSLFNVSSIIEKDLNINDMQASLFKAAGSTTEKIVDAALTVVSNNSLSGGVDSITLTVTDPAVSIIDGAPEIYATTMMNNGLEVYQDCRQINTSF